MKLRFLNIKRITIHTGASLHNVMLAPGLEHTLTAISLESTTGIGDPTMHMPR